MVEWRNLSLKKKDVRGIPDHLTGAKLALDQNSVRSRDGNNFKKTCCNFAP